MHLLEADSPRSSPSHEEKCQQDGQLLLTVDPGKMERQLRRRQKNCAAAQRSRQKYTEKADELHQHERLEKDNKALRREIEALQAEVKSWLWFLDEHNHICPLEGEKRPAPPGTQPPPTPGLHGPPGTRPLQPSSRPSPSPASSAPAQAPPAARAPGPAPDPSELFAPCTISTPPAPLSLVPRPSRPAPSTVPSPPLPSPALTPHLLASGAPPTPACPSGNAGDFGERGMWACPLSRPPTLGLADLRVTELGGSPASPQTEWRGLGLGFGPHPRAPCPLLSFPDM
ncbi:basic leucine zipper transcriptional factor ATF-like 2 isoform X2 [Ornithorhynchus anatinus]|uniref:basic leucine zipper transcriptional factor ATF-like 2 isoform X2 n=1 Tax=Ornithorhynchus anatinus TaxID=9258 RepID=UPI0010A87C5A|nr:basic leucine zipper transcriptional factor ATF-like 2 isoform X2 [Ornithorhynchus anatinus]